MTNDGATILKAIHVDNPAAKVLVNVSKTQDASVGDGTTSVCVLAGELIRESEQLVQQHLHPQIIIGGLRMAAGVALQALEESSVDHKGNEGELRNDLLNIARTTLSSKILRQHKEHFAALAVDAVLRLKGSTDLSRIAIIKKTGGALHESYLDPGFLLEKKVGVGQPKRVQNAKVLVANTAMDADRVKIFSTSIKTDDTAEVAKIEAAERERMYRKCSKIVEHGANVFINRQLIYNLAEQYFADKGVTAIEHADFEGVERLALVLGAEVTSTFDHPELVKLGHADLMEEIMVGESRLIRFSGCAGGAACSIVLRGASQHFLDEAERSIHDALCVLSQTVVQSKTVLGGGAAESLMAQAVEDAARGTPGAASAAMQSAAAALRAIPRILADNAGYDTQTLAAQLRAQHAQGNRDAGLDMDKGLVGNVRALGITESFLVKSSVVRSAFEAAEMILRVDDIIRSAPRKREMDPRYA